MNHRQPLEISLGLLIGGASSRFGAEKHLFQIDGETMLERILRVASPLTDEQLISVREEGQELGVKAKYVPDEFSGAGPLAGIHACLKQMRNEWLLVLACDLPFITTESLDRIIKARRPTSRVVMASSREQGSQPLCACYHTLLVDPIEKSLTEGRNGVFQFLDSVTAIVDVKIPDAELTNVNRPDDLFGRD